MRITIEKVPNNYLLTSDEIFDFELLDASVLNPKQAIIDKPLEQIKTNLKYLFGNDLELEVL